MILKTSPLSLFLSPKTTHPTLCLRPKLTKWPWFWIPKPWFSLCSWDPKRPACSWYWDPTPLSGASPHVVSGTGLGALGSAWELAWGTNSPASHSTCWRPCPCNPNWVYPGQGLVSPGGGGSHEDRVAKYWVCHHCFPSIDQLVNKYWKYHLNIE